MSNACTATPFPLLGEWRRHYAMFWAHIAILGMMDMNGEEDTEIRNASILHIYASIKQNRATFEAMAGNYLARNPFFGHPRFSVLQKRLRLFHFYGKGR